MIRRIQVLHYRGLKYIDIKLSNFQILIGPNASGKSTFLDVINLIRDILNDGLRPAIEKRSSRFDELIYNQQGNGFEIALELEIPEDIKQDYSLIRYEISSQLDNENGFTINNENLWLIKESSLNYKSKENEISIFPSEIEEPETIITFKKRNPVGWKKTVYKTSEGNDRFKAEITNWDFMHTFGPVNSSLAGMSEGEKRRFPITTWVKHLLKDGTNLLQLNSDEMKKPCRPDSPVTLQTDGSNLPKVIRHLQKENPDFFIRWLKHIKAFLPDIEEIKVKERIDDRFLYLSIRYKNGLEIPSWLVSDGTLRFLAQTIIAYLPERDQIYMIEEPENGLHPLAIEGIFQSLSSVYESQVLLATHSPAILNLAEPKQILCFSKTESGSVDIINGQDHPILKNWKRGVDLATLHASGVL